MPNYPKTRTVEEWRAYHRDKRREAVARMSDADRAAAKEKRRQRHAALSAEARTQRAQKAARQYQLRKAIRKAAEPPPETIQERMEKHSDQSGAPGSCWIWTGTLNGRGYGRLSWEGRVRLAHREAWRIANGPIPDGMLVCHRCDVRTCVNPDHLFLGTAKENTADMIAKGRGLVGERVRSSKLTTDEVLAIRADPRPYKAISKEYGIGVPNISWIKTGKGWRHL